MPKIFLPNLMFEEELNATISHVPAGGKRIAAELATAGALMWAPADSNSSELEDSIIVLIDGDFTPAGLPYMLRNIELRTLKSGSETLPAGAEFHPWGWSERAIATGRQLRLEFDTPSSEAVRFVNSRVFLAPFDTCFPRDGDLNRSRPSVSELCSGLSEVEAALMRFREQGLRGWVIKSLYSQAARNRLLGGEPRLNEPQRNWVMKRLAAGEAVCVEPWFDRLAECGLQFTIPPPRASEQEICFDGGCEMLTDALGRYRGSLVWDSSSDAWWTAAVPHGLAIARHARTLGFFGPMGIDCMLIRHPVDGTLWLRPSHDINGRNTMGRIALSLRRWLAPGESGLWCHVIRGSQSTAQDLFEDLDETNVRILPTSPAMHGSRPTTLQTAFLISRDCDQLLKVARTFLSQNTQNPSGIY